MDNGGIIADIVARPQEATADRIYIRTFIHDPDGNMIELVYHPLGVEDSTGHKVELVDDPKSLKWAMRPGVGPSA